MSLTDTLLAKYIIHVVYIEDLKVLFNKSWHGLTSAAKNLDATLVTSHHNYHVSRLSLTQITDNFY